MSLITETKHPGQSILFEMPRHYSRKAATVLSGQNLGACAVVGRVALGVGGMVAVLSGTSPGDGTMTAIFAGPDVEEGAYLVQCTAIATNNGTFSVTAPSGKRLPDAVMAGGSKGYTSSHINFTLTDGSTDFALTALFTVTVGSTAPLVQGGTGNGTLSLHSLGPDAKPGNYKVINRAVVAHGGDFDVIGPDGDSIGRFLMGTTTGAAAAFTSRQVNFTLTDDTDFILANHFNLCVYNKGERGNGKLVAYDPTAVDGRNHVAGVLLGAVDASAGDASGIIVMRNAIVNASDLAWAAAITAAQKQVAINEMDRVLNIVAN